MRQSDGRVKVGAPAFAVTTAEDSFGTALSVREDEIIARVAEGRTNAEISRLLAISPFTVKNHVQRIIKKLGASNRTDAAVRYLQREVRPALRKSAIREIIADTEPADSSA